MSIKNQQGKATFSDYLKSLPLYVLPQHLISALIFKLTRMTTFKDPVIKWFIRQYKVDMSQAETSNINEFKTFNAFFTRALKPGARTVAGLPHQIASPVDGTVSALGEIQNGRIFQAKGQSYSLHELLGGNSEAAELFLNGMFMTVYLSPRDYHRIHMPIDGKLSGQTYIPGRLFSVAPHTVKTIPRLFARNERLVTVFETDKGPMSLVLVGAINVSAIETVWGGLVKPLKGKKIESTKFNSDRDVSLNKGEEMGRFNMGSTVIVLMGADTRWDPALAPGSPLQMGTVIGTAGPHN